MTISAASWVENQRKSPPVRLVSGHTAITNPARRTLNRTAHTASQGSPRPAILVEFDHFRTCRRSEFEQSRLQVRVDPQLLVAKLKCCRAGGGEQGDFSRKVDCSTGLKVLEQEIVRRRAADLALEDPMIVRVNPELLTAISLPKRNEIGRRFGQRLSRKTLCGDA